MSDTTTTVSRVHAPWCVWTVEEEHDPVDECIGAERRVDISRERKLRMTDSSWRRPYMQANIATDEATSPSTWATTRSSVTTSHPTRRSSMPSRSLHLVGQAKGQL
jgi:hypothetical protein